jgi:hypothetical protein
VRKAMLGARRIDFHAADGVGHEVRLRTVRAMVSATGMRAAPGIAVATISVAVSVRMFGRRHALLSRPLNHIPHGGI